jgi:hypothetical protein
MCFYEIGNPVLRGALGVALIDPTTRASVSMQDKDRLLRGELTPGVPVDTKILVGRRLGDIVWAEIYPLVSERVVRAMADAGLTGWATYPVILRGPAGESLAGFRGLAVLGRCRSIRIDRRSPVTVGQLDYWQGLNWDASTWDGSDFFMAADRKTRFILTTAKARDVLRRHRFKWFQATPSTDVRMVAY